MFSFFIYALHPGNINKRNTDYHWQVHILNNRQEILTVIDGAHNFCWEAAQTKTSVIFSKMCVLSFFIRKLLYCNSTRKWMMQCFRTDCPSGIFVRSNNFKQVTCNAVHCQCFMNSYCYQEFQVLDSVSNFMIVNIPIWDATINRICVNDESNTKHLHLHPMLVAA